LVVWGGGGGGGGWGGDVGVGGGWFRVLLAGGVGVFGGFFCSVLGLLEGRSWVVLGGQHAAFLQFSEGKAEAFGEEPGYVR